MPDLIKTFNSFFKNYAIAISGMYLSDRDSILNCLSTESVPGCLNECYMILVREKELDPLERIKTDEKYRYWKESMKYSQDHKQRIYISRSLYLLEQLTNEKSL